jgi:hypothetical protein
MIRGFGEALSLDFDAEAGLGAGENARAEELARTKFSAAEWLYKR